MAHLTRWKRNLQSNLLVNSAICEALSPAVVEENCRQAGYAWRDSFWSPAVTLLTFVLQVLDGAKTLRSAVAVLLTQLAARGDAELPSCDASAYCQARRRLPYEAMVPMLADVTRRAQDLVKGSRMWLGHRVRAVDGTSVSMPDTPELQKAFPQPSAQTPGCGFPVAQLVAVFCWTTGAVLDVVIDTIRPHEMTLFRSLWHLFEPGDVVLADRAYSAYVDMARLLQRGVFCVFRLHQRRQADFRRGRRLGKDDQLVAWERPKWLASFGVTREELEQLPETLAVRLVRITDAPRGFRSRTIVVATTLLDPVEIPADEIRALYRDRWTVELNLRSLKAELGMDVLRGQSVDVVRKEIVMHLLAYNLIRLLMWHAAAEHGRDLHRLSFTGTLHRLRTVFPLLVQHRELQTTLRLIAELLLWIASDRVPHRPNRCEPRRRKRRPKEYSLLTKPRGWYRLHGDDGAR